MEFLELATTFEFWVGLLTLTTLEIVLGIDNLIFITILAGRAPLDQQKKVRKIGLMAALITRLILLASLSYLIKLKNPLFTLFDHPISFHDLILIVGGLFLIGKSTVEIYSTVEGQHLPNAESEDASKKPTSLKSLNSLITQIMLVDIVFSFDSVITAVGMVPHLSVMVMAILIATTVMMIFSGPVGDFIQKHPSFKILALSFLVMIGVLLSAEGFGEHFNRGYIYFGMVFAFFIELLNMRFNHKRKEIPKDH